MFGRMGPRERDAQDRLDRSTTPKTRKEAERSSDQVWEARKRDQRQRQRLDPWGK